MARRELVNSGTKFDDRPENYWSWISTFMNVTERLKLNWDEELDLLARWVGPQSSKQARRIRAVHGNNSAVGLRMAWMHLEECYGSPEVIKNVEQTQEISQDWQQGFPQTERAWRFVKGVGVNIKGLFTWAFLLGHLLGH